MDQDPENVRDPPSLLPEVVTYVWFDLNSLTTVPIVDMSVTTKGLPYFFAPSSVRYCFTVTWFHLPTIDCATLFFEEIKEQIEITPIKRFLKTGR